MRSLSNEVLTAIKAEHQFCHLLQFDFVGVTLGFTDCGFDITYSGVNFESNGLLLGFEDVRSSNEMRVGSYKVLFTAVDPTIVAIMEGTNQVNRFVHVSRAYLDQSAKVIPAPILLHSYLITDHQIESDNKTAKIVLSMASEFANFESTSGRRSTGASQQLHFPDDKGLDFATVTTKQNRWGGE